MSVRVELNLAGFRALRNCPEVVADLDARAEAIRAAAGDGFEVGPARPGAQRARASVFTATGQAMLAEANDAALTRAIDAGRFDA